MLGVVLTTPLMRLRDRIEARLERFRQLNPAMCHDAWGGSAFRPRYKSLFAEGFARLVRFAANELVQPAQSAPRCRILVAVGTRNNYISARASFENIPEAAFFTFHNFALPGTSRLNLFWTYLTGCAALLWLPLLIASGRGTHVRDVLKMRLDCLALSFGHRGNIRRFLRSSGADVFVTMSNLSVFNNMLIEEASRVGMTTVFMTHAPVGRGQVALTTDYAFLDGSFQEKLYPASNTKMLVTGSMRGKLLSRHWRDRSDAQGLIIATNILIREMAQIEAFIEKIKERYPAARVVLRPHAGDRDRLNEHKEICARTGAHYSDPAQPLAEAASGCKYLVTGISGVAVDALLMGLYPLILQCPEMEAATAKIPNDFYGLHELGLAKTISLEDPRLPDSWQIGSELRHLEASNDPGWPTEVKLRSAFEAILRARETAVVEPASSSAQGREAGRDAAVYDSSRRR